MQLSDETLAALWLGAGAVALWRLLPAVLTALGLTLRWGLATPDRGLLLERHREACRDFAGAGSRSVALLPAEEVSRLNRHHESRHHRKSHRWTGLKCVSNSLWVLGVALLLVRRFAGT